MLLDQIPHIGGVESFMTVGMVKGRGKGRDQSGRDTAQILRKDTEIGQPNAESSHLQPNKSPSQKDPAGAKFATRGSLPRRNHSG